MYTIKYFSKDIVGEETKYNIETYTDYEIIENEQGESRLVEVVKERKVPYTEYKYEIKPKEYETTDEEFEYWLDVIQKTYGKYGEVTYVKKQEPPKEPTDIDNMLLALDHLAKELTMEKLNTIRLKSDLSGVGEETVKIKLDNIEKGAI